MVNKKEIETEAVSYNPFEHLEKEFPSTDAQREILASVVVGQDAANCAYNESVTLMLNGDVNYHALQSAVDMVVARHDALRSTFTFDEFAIRFNYKSRIEIQHIDVSGLSDHEKQEIIRELKTAEVNKPFDLKNGPLLRVTLLKKSERSHLLTVTSHHIVCDGWSLSLIIKDLGIFYSALVDGKSIAYEKAPSFAEFAVDEFNYHKTEASKQTVAYWMKQFENSIPQLEFPADKTRPKFRTFNAKRIDVQIPAATVESLRSVSKKQGVSFVTLLISAFEVFLSKETGQNDIVLGLPSAGQNNEGWLNLVGHCVNLLPLYSYVNHEESFLSYLKKRKQYIFDAYDNQRFTFGNLLNNLHIKRDPSRIPLVPVVFNVDIGFSDGFKFSGLEFDFTTNPRNFENFEIFLNASGKDDKLVLECTFNKDLFEDSMMQQKMLQFITLLESIIKDQTETIYNLQILPASEAELIANMNLTAMPYQADQGIHELISALSHSTPERIAVSFTGVPSLTYRELEQKSVRLANSLRLKGSSKGGFVGVCLPRNIDLPVALLAILKTGAAYVPLDPYFPKDRIALMLEDSQAGIVLTTAKLADEFGFPREKVFIIGDEWNESAPDFTPEPVDQEQLAYVLYTSGSTGKPKGVAVRHRNVINELTYMKDIFGITPDDTFMAITTISFDISVLEIFLPLFCGGRVFITTREEALEGSWMEKTILKEKITYLQATPATWELLYASGWKGSADLNILCGGEAFRSDLATRLMNGNKSVWNMYGPTETTEWSTMQKVKQEELDKARNGVISIGTPVANTMIYVVDEFGKPCPLGVAGELWIGGHGVSAGYLNRPDLNKEKFISNPFDDGMVYRTGDRVVMDDRGKLHFINRLDFQVKIRGFRIELGEVESALHLCDGIRQGVVIARPGQMGDHYLAAYFIPETNGEALTQEELQSKIVLEARKKMAKTLPEYMIPTAWLMMETFPLTPNAKVDRKALPDPMLLHSDSIDGHTEMSETENIIAKVWEDILNHKNIKPTDNFFELGGHSLLAVKMMVDLERSTGIKMPLAVLFTQPTVRALAREFEKPQQNERWNPLVIIKDSGNRKPLYFAHGISGNVFKYHLLAQLLDEQQPSYGLQAVGLNGTDEPFTDLEKMAAHHVKEITSFQPEGPYAIAGGSFGGYLAYEIARQLKESGREVPFLCLFDLDAGSELDFMPSGLRKIKSAQLLAERMVKRAIHLIGSDSKQRKEYLQALKKQNTNPNQNELESWLDKHNMAEMIGEESASYFRKVEEACYEALKNYKLRPYTGNILLVRAKEGYFNNTYAEDLGWSHFVNGKVEVQYAPGDHNSIFWEPHVFDLAKIVEGSLSKLLPVHGSVYSVA